MSPVCGVTSSSSTTTPATIRPASPMLLGVGLPKRRARPTSLLTLPKINRNYVREHIFDEVFGIDYTSAEITDASSALEDLVSSSRAPRHPAGNITVLYPPTSRRLTHRPSGLTSHARSGPSTLPGLTTPRARALGVLMKMSSSHLRCSSGHHQT